MDYDNTNSGVLFFEKELKSDKHPNLTGKLNVAGKDYRIAAWEKKSKNDDTFFSLAVSEQKESQDKPSGYEQAKAKAEELKAKSPVVAPATEEDDDEPINLDDIPF